MSNEVNSLKEKLAKLEEEREKKTAMVDEIKSKSEKDAMAAMASASERDNLQKVIDGEREKLVELKKDLENAGLEKKALEDKIDILRSG